MGRDLLSRQDSAPIQFRVCSRPTLAPRFGFGEQRLLFTVAAAILALAAFNLTFRIGQEALQEWDESLYATSAWELVQSGHWVGTTVDGALDYYNTKPPLNIWLIALAFKAFGTSLVSLRLVSIVSAFLTIVLLQWWTWRRFGPRVALLASLILSTTFGFFHIHSARTANTDPLFTLLMLLTAMTLVAEGRRPWLRVWLGPILAAVFLLRGMAVLMPLGVVLIAGLLTRRQVPRQWAPSAAASALFVMPVVAWGLARYRLDRWEFLGRMFSYDFVERSVQPIEGHTGGVLYYLDILHRNQFDWLAVSVLCLLLFPRHWPALRTVCLEVRTNRMTSVLVAWAIVTLAMPTFMQTKLPWYLNPFYPVFATATALFVTRAYDCLSLTRAASRYAIALTAALVVVAAAAESRLLWYSYAFRDLKLSGQHLILQEREQLRGRRLHQDQYRRASTFVAGALVGAKPQMPPVDVCCGLDDIQPGDYLLAGERIRNSELELVRSNARRWLYRRKEP